MYTCIHTHDVCIYNIHTHTCVYVCVCVSVSGPGIFPKVGVLRFVEGIRLLRMGHLLSVVW